ncbi:MAG TPA: hypothetical protein VF957_20575 [Bradyrhizobium sp.]
MHSIGGYPLRTFTIAACCLGLLGGKPAFGQDGSWHDDKPGITRLLRLQDLPAPSKPTYRATQVVPASATCRS